MPCKIINFLTNISSNFGLQKLYREITILKLFVIPRYKYFAFTRDACDINNFFKILLNVTRILNFLCIGLIICLRPLLGPSPSGCCKFEIGCTEYAINQLQNKTLYYAIVLICKRLFNCNPFSKIPPFYN